MAESDKLEEGEECRDEFAAGGLSGEKFLEFERFIFGEDLQHVFDLFRNGETVGFDFPLRSLALFEALEHALEGGDQVQGTHLAGEQSRTTIRRRSRGGAPEKFCPQLLTVAQIARGFFEFFVFDELADQFPARIFLFALVFDRSLQIDRQQGAAFDVEKIRGHDDELAADLDVDGLHRLEIFEVLPGDPLDRNVINIHLVLAHEVEQEVERSLEDVEFDLVSRVGHGPGSKTALTALGCFLHLVFLAGDKARFAFAQLAGQFVHHQIDGRIQIGFAVLGMDVGARHGNVDLDHIVALLFRLVVHQDDMGRDDTVGFVVEVGQLVHYVGIDGPGEHQMARTQMDMHTLPINHRRCPQPTQIGITRGDFPL